MDGDDYAKLATLPFQIVALLLTGLFWLAFVVLLMPHVPTEHPVWKVVFAAFTATSVTGVFYLAVHMFWVVLQDDRRARKASR